MQRWGITILLWAAACGGSSATPGLKASELPDSAAAFDAGGDAPTRAPLDVTITVHLENDAPYDANYAAQLRAFATAFEAHGAWLTMEPRQETLMGTPDIRTAFADLEAAGHAFGSHAAIGTTAGLTQAAFDMQVAARRTALLGVVHRVDHVSGVCSTLDFVEASAGAGFKLTTGATVLCLQAMAPEDRPAEYHDLICASATDPKCHQSYPSAVEQRIHPWRARNGAHWLTDEPSGTLVVLPGSGSLPCLEEEAMSNGMSISACTLTDGDVTLALADLDDAIAQVDAGRVNSYYWIWGSWKHANIDYAVLERLLTAMDERRARGDVRWKTGPAVYDEYIAWEATHR